MTELRATFSPADPTADERGRGAQSRPEHPRGWMRLAPLAFLAAAAVAVAVRDPHVAGAWGTCPTFWLFGVYCPGCGSLRAMNDLVHGQVAAAVGENALLIPAIAFVVWATLRTPGPAWSRIWLVAVIVFTIARNLPGSPLAP